MHPVHALATASLREQAERDGCAVVVADRGVHRGVQQVAHRATGIGQGRELRAFVGEATESQVRERVGLARSLFAVDGSVNDDDFAWGAKVSVGLDRLITEFDLDSLAYYHRGLAGEQHERLGRA
ncbi:hypothetical protein [Arthrobacter sp. TMS1-12-1]